MRTNTTAATATASKTTTAARKSASTPATSRTTAKPAKASQAKASTPPAAISPSVCVTARVRPEDALWIATRCKNADHLEPWFVAGVAAEIGEAVLRGDRYRTIGLDVISGNATAQSLWRVINRDECDFTETIPVFIPEGDRYQAEQDADSMRRDLGDWLGTEIMLGVEMAKAGKGLSFLTHYREFGLLAHAAKLRAIEEGKAAEAG